LKRKIYLKKTPWQEALHVFLSKCEASIPVASEEISVEESLGRVAAEDVVAHISSPHYNASAMDGVAVASGETIGADLSAPKRLKIGEDAEFVDTGAPLPQGFDAVVQIEDVHHVDADTIEINSAVAPWHYVRQVGEDIREGDLLVIRDSVIDPYDIGALLAGGVTSIPVRRKPRVGVLPTGSELVEPGDELKPGSTVEFNSRMVKALVTQWGGLCHRYAPVGDERDSLQETVGRISGENDVLLIIAGSSAGRRDFTPQIIEDLGEVFVHGVNVMPGKPVVLGRIEKRPVVGLPGYPVSAAIIMDLFVKPLLFAMLGVPPPERPRVQARLSQRVVSKLGMEEFVRVTLSGQNGEVTAAPLGRGAGVITSLAKADGFLVVPADVEGLEAGAMVEVELLKGSWRVSG